VTQKKVVRLFFCILIEILMVLVFFFSTRRFCFFFLFPFLLPIFAVISHVNGGNGINIAIGFFFREINCSLNPIS